MDKITRSKAYLGGWGARNYCLSMLHEREQEGEQRCACVDAREASGMK
jgi:hypothetical protein